MSENRNEVMAMVSFIFGAPLLRWVIFSFFFLAFALNVSIHSDQTFVDLASSFLHGKLYLISDTTYDTALFSGKHYWPLGPFPAVFLMPFVFIAAKFGFIFWQGYANIFLGIGVFILCFLIARRLNASQRDAVYWAMAFCFASVFFGVLFLPVYAHFAHMIAVMFLLGGILEYLSGRRYWIMGSLMALAAMTRMTAGVGVVFFLLDVLFSKTSRTEKRKNCMALLVPFGVGVLLLMAYNFLRFGNVLEQGYGLQYLAYDSLRVARDYGILNIVHVPGNLFYALFAGVIPIFQDQFSHVLRFPFVRPDPWGMSLFITSPYLFLLFFFKYRERTSWLLIASIICIAVPIFLYYGIGFRQFGYRYALDFFPFLFFLFMREYMTSRAVLSRGMKVLIISSSFVNLWLFGGFLFYGNI